MAFRIDLSGAGWVGWRGVYAILLASPQLGLAVHWFTYGKISLGTGMFYLTLIPFMLAVALTAFLPGKSPLTTKTLGIISVWALLPYSLYDWGRVPMNAVFGIPFWDHWFDWGSSISGYVPFTYEALSVGLIAHAMRGWGFGAAYFLLVRRVTLLSSFVWAWVMTTLYWIAFPIFILTDSLPPFIWWFTAWLSHMVFAFGLFIAPTVFSYYMGSYSSSDRASSAPIPVGPSSLFANRRGELFAILSSQGFGLIIGAALFGYVVDRSAYVWAVPGAVVGIAFLALALRFRSKPGKIVEPIG